MMVGQARNWFTANIGLKYSDSQGFGLNIH